MRRSSGTGTLCDKITPARCQEGPEQALGQLWHVLRALIEGMVSLVMGGDDGDEPPLQERRERVRLRCHYPVKVTAGKQTFRSVVTDVGPRGMRLKFVSSLRKGALVSIRYDQEPTSPIGREGEAIVQDSRPPVQCRAVWCRKRRFSPDRIAGVEFVGDDTTVSSSWVGLVLDELGFPVEGDSTLRRWVRADTHFPASIRAGQDPFVETRVVNLGVGGAMLLADTSPGEPGSPVTILMGPWEGLPALEARGELLGAEKDELVDGMLLRVRFEHTDPEQVDRLGRYVLHMLREKHL